MTFSANLNASVGWIERRTGNAQRRTAYVAFHLRFVQHRALGRKVSGCVGATIAKCTPVAMKPHVFSVVVGNASCENRINPTLAPPARA
jgi:hypothetical protein